MGIDETFRAPCLFRRRCIRPDARVDTSGNGLLTGTYNFREALWITDEQGSNALNKWPATGPSLSTGKATIRRPWLPGVLFDSTVTNYVRTGTYAILRQRLRLHPAREE
jgi:hypothetical protein